MTSKEYLNQAYRLNEKINSDLAELDDLRHMATSIGSPSLEEHFSGTRQTDPPFLRAIIKIDEMERKINAEIDRYVDLKKEINDAIKAVPSTDEQMLLRYRYINGYGWNKIGVLMSISLRTVHRIHATALRNFSIPN